MAEAAGVLIVRGGRVLLSPRGPYLGWIGGTVEPGETPVEAARREAREEIGCEVEILHAPATYEASDSVLLGLAPPAPLLRTPRAVAFLARALGEPRPVDVGELTWLPVDELPSVPAAEGSVVALLRDVVAAFGPGVLGEGDEHERRT